ncbi:MULTISPECIES: oxidoreductase [Rhizobium]|uniref:Aryl-alcohol dehydrogenase-like predicted oxidoreductase n=1 Tax=Rhizobium paranaense TaxID=1650438 RepID=A0A7W8XXK0_9HYPH|nr:oxidoreductase [Rhizobium paranaense]MBB5577381.1 aryl-alcohol dehydrogenase-like predicted oxidoreductase [Rhizobium paranaense]
MQHSRFNLPGTSIQLSRLGYGTMQLPGPHVWGPPRDRDAALAVLREAVNLGANHIDTAEFYGPRVANELIREALFPYPEDLFIATKVGFERGNDGSWFPDLSRDALEGAVYQNLETLGVDVLDLVNLRVGGATGPAEGSISEPLSVLAGLQSKGLIKHIGLSNVSQVQFEEARSVTSIVCVQNQYNLVHRNDDDFINELSRQGVAYVPFFPLGGFTPVQSASLSQVASSLGATEKQVALAWLLQRAPNILVIAGTSSVQHLRENFAAGALVLLPEHLSTLDNIASQGKAA